MVASLEQLLPRGSCIYKMGTIALSLRLKTKFRFLLSQLSALTVDWLIETRIFQQPQLASRFAENGEPTKVSSKK